jgi:hypothetical protein
VLAVSVNYGAGGTFNLDQLATSVPTHLIDLNKGERSVEFEVEFGGTRPWIPVDIDVTAAQASLEFYELVPLASNASSENVAVLVFVSAGEGYELARPTMQNVNYRTLRLNPTQDNPYSTGLVKLQSNGEGEGTMASILEEKVSADSVEENDFPKFKMVRYPVTKVFFGEQFDNLKDLMLKYSYYGRYNLNTSATEYGQGRLQAFWFPLIPQPATVVTADWRMGAVLTPTS